MLLRRKSISDATYSVEYIAILRHDRGNDPENPMLLVIVTPRLLLHCSQFTHSNLGPH